MNVLYNNEIPINSWVKLIDKNIHATPFQTPDFFHMFNSFPGFTTRAVAVSEGELILSLAVIALQKEKGIKSYFSRRGIIYGGPLVDSDYPEALDLLLSELKRKPFGNVIYYECRNFSDYKAYAHIFNKLDWKLTPHINLIINLQDKRIDDILAQMKYNRRREIKLSLSEGAKYEICQKENELECFYKILKDLYGKKLKLPLPDYAFFRQLWLSSLAKVFIVYHGNNIIGGSFCLFQPGKSIFTMYYCGERNYKKKIFPTHLAILAPIEFAINSGITHFDFMGAGRSDVGYGVRRYKQEFGGDLIEFGRYLSINNCFLYNLGLLYYNLIKKKGE